MNLATPYSAAPTLRFALLVLLAGAALPRPAAPLGPAAPLPRTGSGGLVSITGGAGTLPGRRPLGPLISGGALVDLLPPAPAKTAVVPLSQRDCPGCGNYTFAFSYGDAIRCTVEKNEIVCRAADPKNCKSKGGEIRCARPRPGERR